LDHRIVIEEKCKAHVGCQGIAESDINAIHPDKETTKTGRSELGRVYRCYRATSVSDLATIYMGKTN
jgi:hypothetical protein